MPDAPVLWPRPLRAGGFIGICSPAGPSPADSLARAAHALAARGFWVVVGPHAADRNDEAPYLAGDDAARLSDLNDFLADPAIGMILCARGGYGSMRLLDQIDYAAARRYPKPIVGYSDITALSLALHARAGIVSFSGIMATAGDGIGEDTLDPYSEASLWANVTAQTPLILTPPADAAPWSVLRGGGVVSGPVFPVCLSLLIALLGTPYVPDLTGAILVIEDVHEPLYAIDRALTQLRLAGVLDKLAALLLGSFNGTTPDEDAALALAVPRLAADFAPASVAIASGVAYGHIRRRLTLPVGAIGTVDLGRGAFTFGRAD